MTADKYDWLAIFEGMDFDGWGRPVRLEDLLSILDNYWESFPLPAKIDEFIGTRYDRQAPQLTERVGHSIKTLVICLETSGHGSLAARVERDLEELWVAVCLYDTLRVKPNLEIRVDEEVENPDGSTSRWTVTELDEAVWDVRGNAIALAGTLRLMREARWLAVTAGEADRGRNANPTKGGAPGKLKRAARAAAIEKIEKELRKYLAASRDSIRAQRLAKKPTIKLLPRPTKVQLAKDTGIKYHTLCRCFTDTRAEELRRLYAMFTDVDALMRRELGIPMQVCPSCQDRHQFRCTEPRCTDGFDGRCEECHQELVHGG